jgi:hypothetical protein
MPNHDDRPMSEGGGESERGIQPGGGREVTGAERGRVRGWVMPYRYSGPGYAGWGYYSVLYHGTEEQGDEEESWSGTDIGHEGSTSRREGGQGQGGQGYGGYGGFGESRERGFEPGGRSPWGESSFEQGEGGRGGQYPERGGQYAGRGPRGYRRSAERLKEEVCERLTEHGWVDASDIEVDVRDGEVTLRGTVPDRRMKRMAADLADEIRGVDDVHNEIRVRREDESGQDKGRAGRQEARRSSSGSGSRKSAAEQSGFGKSGAEKLGAEKSGAEKARAGSAEAGSRQRKGGTGSRPSRSGERSDSPREDREEQATQQG